MDTGTAIELAVKSLMYLKDYYSEVKAAESELRQFTEYLTQDLQALNDLQVLYERLKQQPNLSSNSVECLHSLETLFHQDSNQPESENFYKELRELVEWLEKQALRKKSGSMRKRIVGFFKGKKNTGTEGAEMEKGMGLSQKLKWPMKGKKKIEKIMPKLEWHKDHLIFALQLTQTHLSVDLMGKSGTLPMSSNHLYLAWGDAKCAIPTQLFFLLKRNVGMPDFADHCVLVGHGL